MNFCDGVNTKVDECGICWPMTAVNFNYYWISDFIPTMIIALFICP